MALSYKHQVGLVCLILVFPALCSCQEYVNNSRASYYNTPDGLGNPNGACGFGGYGRMMNNYNGNVAAVSGLWRNGGGCGACYEVWCKLPHYCNRKGVIVVATDYGVGDRTEFIMSKHGFSGLALNGEASKELFKRGVVDIGFKRVPCKYNGYIKLHIQESSRNPGYFAVLFLNVNGVSDITAVQMWQRKLQRWEPLRRVYGAVFDFANPPSGAILLRLQLGYKWLPLITIPANWKPGATYGTKIQPY